MTDRDRDAAGAGGGDLSALGAQTRAALGARCLMRLPPRLGPTTTDPAELGRRVGELERTWTLASLVAIGRLEKAPDQLVEELEQALPEEDLVSASANRLVLELVLAATGSSPPPSVAHDSLARLRDVMVMAWDVDPDTEQIAFADDLEAALAFAPGGSQPPGVPPSFFTRPLWSAHRPALEEQLEGWRDLLLSSELPDLAKRYELLVAGEAFDRETAESLVAVQLRELYWPEGEDRPREKAATARKGSSRKRKTARPGSRPTSGSGDPQVDATEARAVAMRILADQPISSVDDDRLNFRDYADALVGLIDGKKTKTPLTLAISARWGVGKSSLANMVIDLLRRQVRSRGPRHVICQFNAWHHDQADDLTPAFIAHVARTAEQHRPLWRRILHPIPAVLLEPHRRVRARVRRTALLLLAAAVLTLAGARTWYGVTVPAAAGSKAPGFGEWSDQQVARVVGGVRSLLDPGPSTGSTEPGGTDRAGDAPQSLSPVAQGAARSAWVALLVLLWHFKEFFFGVARKLADFVSDPEAAARSGSLPEVRKQLHTLIEHACRGGSRRFVLFVDDLERCRVPRAVDLLEAVNQLVNRAGVVTVVMADMPAVAAHVELKYERLAGLYDPRTGRAGPPSVPDSGAFASRAFGRDYLRKIIQLQFDLPEVQSIDHVRRILVSQDQAEGRPLADLLTETLDSIHRQPWGEGAFAGPLRDNMKRWDGRLWWAPLWVVLGWLLSLPGIAVGGLSLRLASLLPLSSYSSHRRPASVPGRLSAMLSLALAPGALALLATAPTATDGLIRIGGTAAVVLALIALLLVSDEVTARLIGYLRVRRSAAAERTFRKRSKGQPEPSYEEFREALQKENPRLQPFLESSEGKALLRERHLSYLGEKSSLLEEAENLAADYLPPIPRHVKRFHNRLRLLLYICDLRKMFRGNRLLAARQLGKWAVMQELWPELTGKLAHTPDKMASLEKRLAGGKIDEVGCRETIAKLTPQYARDDLLVRLLGDEPELAGCLKRLTRFEAKATAGPETAVPATA